MALARSMGIAPKVLWAMGDDQVDLLIAADELEADVGPHGHFMSEATSPQADPNNYEPGGWRYVAHAVVDQAQRAVIVARKELQSQTPGEDIGDLRFVVEKIDND